MNISRCKKLKDSIVEISESDKSPEELNIINTLFQKTHRIRCVGSTALSLAYVACGWLECRIKTTVGSYDVAGGALMIREAGGVVTDFSGNYWKQDKHTSMLATTKILKTKFLEILK